MAKIYQFVSDVDGPRTPFIGDPKTHYYQIDEETWIDASENTGRMLSWDFDPARDWPLAVDFWIDGWMFDDPEEEEKEFRRWLVREMRFTGREAFQTWRAIKAHKKTLSE